MSLTLVMETKQRDMYDETLRLKLNEPSVQLKNARHSAHRDSIKYMLVASHLLARPEVTVGSLIHIQVFMADHVFAFDGFRCVKKTAGNFKILLHLIAREIRYHNCLFFNCLISD